MQFVSPWMDTTVLTLEIVAVRQHRNMEAANQDNISAKKVGFLILTFPVFACFCVVYLTFMPGGGSADLRWTWEII